MDYNINERNSTWFRFQADTGVQAAYTDSINRIFDAVSPQPLYSFAAGYTHVFSQNLVNYFNPAFSWYKSLFGPANLQETLSAFPIVLQGIGANAPHIFIRSVTQKVRTTVQANIVFGESSWFPWIHHRHFCVRKVADVSRNNC